ncbi:MAG: FadR family transcriptional regulator [Planctomycetes bacterium]|nr:FadR family transcriptional regulator [Planctomycetota bacterium]
MPQVLERRNLSDQVAERIKEFIIDRGLKPGDRLPTEHDLADRFGVSRISIREATKALAFIGILDSAPRRGLSVGLVNMHRVSEFLGFHLAINDYPSEQLIETRIVIETGGLPLAAKRIAQYPAIYDRLCDLNDQLLAAKQIEKWIKLDIAFHRELLDASGLKPLVAFNDLLDLFFRRFRESVKKAEWAPGVESHQRLIDALRDGQLQSACDELREHIESHKTRD